ncbi:MAG: lipopolysaccharide biosynthesis protein [Vicinamibacterales bacterium]
MDTSSRIASSQRVLSAPASAVSSDSRSLVERCLDLWRTLGSSFLGPTAQRSGLSLLDQIVNSGTSFATSVVIGRLGSRTEFRREELGIYFLGLSLVLFVRGLQSESILSSYTIFFHRRSGPSLDAYRGSKLVHHLVISALFTIGLVVFALWRANAAGLTDVLWILAGAAPFLLLREYLRQLSFAHLRLTAALVLDTSVSVLQVGGLLLLAWFHVLTAGTAFTVMGVSCALVCLGWFLCAKQPVRIVSADIVSDWRTDWPFARWSLASYLVGCSTPYVMPWLILRAHGVVATGALAACAQLANITSLYVLGVTNVLLPQAATALAQDGLDGLRGVLRHTAWLVIGPLAPFCLLVFLTGDLAVVFVYGPAFVGTGLVLTLLTTAVLLNGLGSVAGNGLYAMQRPHSNLVADLCVLLVTVALSLWLLPPLGVTGAAIATLGGVTAGVVARWGTLLRLMRGPATGDPAVGQVLDSPDSINRRT